MEEPGSLRSKRSEELAVMLKVIAALAPGGAGVQLDRITLAQPNGKSLGAQHAKLTDNLEAYAAATACVSDRCGAGAGCAHLI